MSLSWFALRLTECKTEKLMKKARGENEIEAALERLDRLIDDEVRATVAQTLQAVNKAERELLPICDFL